MYLWIEFNNCDTKSDATYEHLLPVEDEMLFATSEPLARTERAKVRFENDIVSIPDLDYIEASFRNVLIT